MAIPIAVVGFMLAASEIRAGADDSSSEGAPAIPRKVVTSAKPPKVTAGTHTKVAYIKVKAEAKGQSLQTFCLNSEGNVLAVVGYPKQFVGKRDDEKSKGEVQTFDPEGKKLKTWSVTFAPQAINVGPDGKVYVAGEGRLAIYGTSGDLLTEAELPHTAMLLKDTEAIRQNAEDQIRERKEQYNQQLETLKTQRDEILKREEQAKQRLEKEQEAREKSTDGEEGKKAAAPKPRRRVSVSTANLDSQIKMFQQMVDQQDKLTVESVAKGIVDGLKGVNALAVSETDLFVVSRQTKGYAYSIWRLSHDLQDPKEIVSGLSGCCGQMDIQCCNGQVWAAENSRHRVCGFDREGKKVASWGKADRDGAGECFGSCCNPMNLRFARDGRVYTAESEGLVKLFAPDGTFDKLLGRVTLSGGCKNVAVDASPDGRHIFFCDLPGSRIIVLTLPDPATAKAD